MMTSKEPIVAAVSAARTSLDLALAELEKIPSFDSNRVGYVAHALGNYLTVTMGTLDLLSASLEDHQDPEVHTWLSGLEQVTQRMSQSVQQLLAINSSDRSKLFFDKVDLGLLAQRAVTFYTKLAAKKGIQIEVLPIPSPAVAWTDRVGTAVVLDNLLSNAVKYSPTGKTVHVSISSQETEVLCSIRDEGPGISDIDQARYSREEHVLARYPLEVRAPRVLVLRLQKK